MSIDLESNREEIVKAFWDVLNEKSKTDWCLFGYQGMTNTLKFVGCGEEGIEEMADDLNSSKIMYGILRHFDPKMIRHKIILINWQGEATPNVHKGTCARHLGDIKKLFHGFHITYTARCDDDIDINLISDAVVKATSTEYNFKERSEIPEKTAPVGTNYSRTIAQHEINLQKRSQFWDEQELVEKRRKEMEIQKKEEEAKVIERQRTEREIEAANHREELNKERNARIFATKKAEKSAYEKTLKTSDKFEEQQKMIEDRENEEHERAHRPDVLRNQRKQEAESLIAGTTHERRSLFEKNTVSMPQREFFKRPTKKLHDFVPKNYDQETCSITTAAPTSNYFESGPNNDVTSPRSIKSRWPPLQDQNDQVKVENITSVCGKVKQWQGVSETYNEKSVPSKVQYERSNVQSETSSKNSFSSYQNNVLHFKSNASSTAKTGSNSHDNVNTTKNNSLVMNIPNDFPDYTESSNKNNLDSPKQRQESTNIKNDNAKYIFEPTISTTKNDFDNIKFTEEPTKITTNTANYTENSLNDTKNTRDNLYANVEYEAAVDVSRSNGFHSYSTTAADTVSGNYSQNNISQNSSNVDSTTSAYSQNDAIINTFNKNDNNQTKYNEIVNTSYSVANATSPNDSYAATNGSTNEFTEEMIKNTSVAMTYEIDGIEYQLLPEHGLCARALYDYQSADDTEISFDPGDILTNIDQIDAGWWQGASPSGIFGLFPANYVELINAADNT